MLINGEPNAVNAASRAVFTGENEVRCCVWRGSSFPLTSVVFLCISSVLMNLVYNIEDRMTPGITVRYHVWPVKRVNMTCVEGHNKAVIVANVGAPLPVFHWIVQDTRQSLIDDGPPFMKHVLPIGAGTPIACLQCCWSRLVPEINCSLWSHSS